MGKALYFDGIDDYVEVPHSTSLGITGDLTLAAWVRFEAGGTINPRIVSKLAHNGGTDEPGYELSTSSTQATRKWFFVASLVSEQLESPGRLEVGDWHLLVGTRRSDTLSMYQDDSLVARRLTSTSLDPGNLPLAIGRKSVFGFDQFKGVIDEVRVYNRALTENQLASLWRERSHR